jgi:hypothetical protein
MRKIFGPKGVEVTVEGRPIASTTLVWLRIRTCCTLLYTWKLIFRFHKMWEISGIEEGLLAPQVGFGFIELAIW